MLYSYIKRGESNNVHLRGNSTLIPSTRVHKHSPCGRLRPGFPFQGHSLQLTTCNPDVQTVQGVRPEADSSIHVLFTSQSAHGKAHNAVPRSFMQRTVLHDQEPLHASRRLTLHS
jgi:hypothetical protein